MEIIHITEQVREYAKTVFQLLAGENRKLVIPTIAIMKGGSNINTTIDILALFRLCSRSCSIQVTPSRNYFSIPKG